jgi:ABC-type sugar transport system ATPase subunit
VLLEMKAISKSFHGITVLHNVHFRLREGEVHALVGENGAGKSTLMKILAGIYEPEEGEVLLRGQKVYIDSPTVSQRLGISVIHQELNLVPYMTVAENIFLGREPNKKGWLSYDHMVKGTVQLLGQLGLDLNPKAYVHSLSIGEQQIVEIAKALSIHADILIMDEPTAVLTEYEASKLFQLIEKLKKQGVGIVYISHRLSEIKRVCDRMTVLRDGQLVTTCDTDEVTERDIANLMVGRELQNLYPEKPDRIGNEVLRVEKLSKAPYFHNVSFRLRRGEIVGFAGLIGAGRTELVRAIFGDIRPDAGKVYVQGEEVHIRSPANAIQHGIGFSTEDRKKTGLFMDLSVGQNVILPSLNNVSRMSFVNRRRERALVKKKVEELKIKLNHLNQPVKNLSGGNQQKVVLAKWLLAETELFFLDEPTRGIDVGAKGEIYQLIARLAADGKGVVIISSELPELLGLCNRIVVMHKGQVQGELDAREATEQAIMAMATGL